MLGFLLNFFQPKWKHSNPKTREKAIRKLGATGKKTATKILLDALGDSHESVRTAATESLSQMGSRVIEPLVQSLSSPDPSVRKVAVIALGATDDSRAIKPLINVLVDEDSGVRKTIIETLSKIGDSQVIDPLINALADNESYVRKAASDALRILAGKVGDMDAKKLASSYNRDMKRMLDRLARSGDFRATTPISKVLREGTWTVRPLAMEALGKFNNPQVIELLLIGLEDENFETRLSGIKALGSFHDSRVVEPMIKCLSDTEWSVREEAAKALGQLNAGNAVTSLITAISDEKCQVRRAAATALVSLHESKNISDEQKAMILQHRDTIIAKHTDAVENKGARHVDAGGIGVEFPVAVTRPASVKIVT
jgi:HEAT repeat protein